ncbi:sensor histidine kinase [Paenibacillus eucommiae]|uniref:histidine kinase n=1 Tax=Paenibacillus eucommiae TaxID=1355755 RepID=A0ABS4IVU7_9BACL|nr:ATP-binding protein [Paenibacillus eucommiae]MBP1991697.1 signal transduction histidine kinase [Paenibacillus eucommiae]
MTLKTKLSLMFSIILMATLIIFGTVLYTFLHNYIYNDIQKNIAYKVEAINKSISFKFTFSKKAWNLFINIDEYELLQEGMFIQITNFSNGLVTKSNNLKYFELPLERDKVNEKPFYDTVTLYDTAILVYTYPIVLNGEIVGTIQSGININQFENFFRVLRFSLYMLTLGVVLLAVILGMFFSKKFLSPIHMLIQKLDQIRGTGKLTERIYYKNPNDEIGQLTVAINSMLESIEGNYTKINNLYMTQQRFVADASHELRTPLTSISGNAQLLRKVWERATPEYIDTEMLRDSLESIDDIVEESDRMRKLVSDLLYLARSDSQMNIELEKVELLPIVESVIRKVDVLPKQIQWSTSSLDLLEDAYILGNRDYLQQLLFIFLENAFKFTLSGSVELSIERKEQMIGISIKDTGIGLANSEIPFIFDRFYRADNSRGQIEGTGLGLSIAKIIIDEHHASVDVTSYKGEGSIFTVWFDLVD